jgi:hypothetical protein
LHGPLVWGVRGIAGDAKFRAGPMTPGWWWGDEPLVYDGDDRKTICNSTRNETYEFVPPQWFPSNMTASEHERSRRRRLQ